MRETQAIIERVRRVTPDLQQLDLSVDAALAQLEPGQSVLAHLLDNTSWDPYLRQQWIPVAVQRGHLTVEMPTGPVYAPGQVVSLLSPVGRAIPLRPNLSRMLMIADRTLPTPLVLLARQLVADGVEITLVLGEEATRYPLELLPPEVEILRGDTDWKWPDQVEMLNWADQVLVLASSLVQSEVYGGVFNTIDQLRHQAIPDGYVCGLYYPRLGCGAGACQACLVPARRGDLLACTDGPALDLKKVKFR